MAKRTCLYAILGVAKDADEKTISKAYKKAALKWHPDRNYGNEEEATEQFKLVQEAHETLMDKNERAWYDSHRNQILRGMHESEMTNKAVDTDHLYAFFSSRCFCGMEGEDGFFAVYDRVFKDIDDGEGQKVAPFFGKADSPWKEVSAFYSHFTNFSSKRDFSGANKWNLSQGETRQVRRLMEKQNKKFRKEQRQSYNSLIRRLAAWVKRRDPRVAQRNLEVVRMKEKKAREKKALEMEKQKQLEEAREQRRLEWEKLRETNPEMFESSSEEVEIIQELFECICCDKRFKSENALESHNRSKKHKVQYKKMLQKLKDEEFMAGIGASEFKSEDLFAPAAETTNLEGNRPGRKKKRKKKRSKQETVEGKDDDQSDTKSFTLQPNAADQERPWGYCTIETSENSCPETSQKKASVPQEIKIEDKSAPKESSPELKESSDKNSSKSTSKQDSPTQQESTQTEPQDLESDKLLPTKQDSQSEQTESPKKDPEDAHLEPQSTQTQPSSEQGVESRIPEPKDDRPIAERVENIEITEEHGKKKKRRRRKKGDKKNKSVKLNLFQCLHCKTQFESRNQVMRHLKANPKHAIPYLKLQEEHVGEEMDRNPRERLTKKKRKKKR